MTLQQYISSINNSYKPGNETEQTLRGDVQQPILIIEQLVPQIAEEKNRQFFSQIP